MWGFFFVGWGLLVGLGFFVRFGFLSFFLLIEADQKTTILFCGYYKT